MAIRLSAGRVLSDAARRRLEASGAAAGGEIDLTTPEGRQALQDATAGRGKGKASRGAQKPAGAAKKQSREGAGPRFQRACDAGWRFSVMALPEGCRAYAWRGKERTPYLPVGDGECSSPDASAGEQWAFVLDWIEAQCDQS